MVITSGSPYRLATDIDLQIDLDLRRGGLGGQTSRQE